MEKAVNILFTKYKSKNRSLNSHSIIPPMATSKCPDSTVNQDILSFKAKFISAILDDFYYHTRRNKNTLP